MKHIRFCQDLINFVERGHGHSSQKEVDTGMRRKKIFQKREKKEEKRKREK